jgi:hypothetical protein
METGIERSRIPDGEKEVTDETHELNHRRL